MRIGPDSTIAIGMFTVCVHVIAIHSKVFDCLVDCHGIWKHVAANEKLQSMFGRPLRYRHRCLLNQRTWIKKTTQSEYKSKLSSNCFTCSVCFGL